MSKPNAGGRPMVVDGLQVSRHVVSFVEGELRLYPVRTRRLSYIEVCITTATANFEEGMPRASGVGNPTLIRMMALQNDRERSELKGWIDMVEEVMSMLDHPQRDVIKHLYFANRLKPEGVAEEMHLGVATVYRLRNRALLAFTVAMVGDRAIDRKVIKNRGA